MKKILILLLAVSFFATGGCAVHFYKKSPKDKAAIEKLSSEVQSLKALRAKERQEFRAIEKELREELKGQNVKLKMVKERGLVITLADNILFDSGKAKIKKEAYPTLNKIAAIIKASDKDIGIEGHTDNVPIKHSGWKSNRELSTARANNVYHYLVKKGLSPSKLTTIGYGEHRPVANNTTVANRARNRRVEIVILPKYLKRSAKDVKGENWAK